MVLITSSIKTLRALIDEIALSTASLKLIEEAVYLGHIISSNRKDCSDVNKQVKKVNTIRNVMICEFASCSENVTCELFRADCSAVPCSSLWCSYNLARYRKTKVSHNDILLHGVPRYTSARTCQ